MMVFVASLLNIIFTFLFQHPKSANKGVNFSASLNRI